MPTLQLADNGHHLSVSITVLKQQQSKSSNTIPIQQATRPSLLRHNFRQEKRANTGIFHLNTNIKRL